MISLASFGMEEHEPKLDRVCRLFIRVVNISKKKSKNLKKKIELKKIKKNFRNLRIQKFKIIPKIERKEKIQNPKLL